MSAGRFEIQYFTGSASSPALRDQPCEWDRAIVGRF
jgi:hypothetical protein